MNTDDVELFNKIGKTITVIKFPYKFTYKGCDCEVKRFNAGEIFRPTDWEYAYKYQGIAMCKSRRCKIFLKEEPIKELISKTKQLVDKTLSRIE